MKKEISIFGCGWLGEPLAIKLIESGYKVKGSTTTPNKLDHLVSLGIKAFLIDLDVLDDSIGDFLDTDILIIATPSKNIDGFRKLIFQIEKSRIQKIIFISSTSVYKNSNGIVTEVSSVKDIPLVEIEKLFKTNRHFQTNIIRFAGLMGYDRKPGNFFPVGKKIPNPDGYVNMIHRDDCIGIITTIIKKGLWGETFNACADTHPTRREFYTNAAIELGKDRPEFEESNLSEYKIVSNKKLKTILDYQFKYPDILNIIE